jgi:hypothetical protein
MSKNTVGVFEIIDLDECELIDKDPHDDDTSVSLTGLYELTGHCEDTIEIVEQDFDDEDPIWTVEELADELKLGDIVIYKGSKMVVQSMEKCDDGEGGFNLSVMLTDE